MEIFGGPAALGGIIVCVGLLAWMLGRWQGAVAPAGDQQGVAALTAASAQRNRQASAHTGSAPGVPCQPAAQTERTCPPEAACPIGDLHAEVTAYRRAQQVLAGLGRDQLDLVLIASDAGQACRNVGAGGEPVYPVPAEAYLNAVCEIGFEPFDPLPQRAFQPSPAVSDVTRV